MKTLWSPKLTLFRAEESYNAMTNASYKTLELKF